MTSLLSLMVRAVPSKARPLEDLLGAPFADFFPGLLQASVQLRLQSALAAPNALDGAAETQDLRVLANALARVLSDEFQVGLSHLSLAGALEDEYALLLVSLTASSGGRRGVLSASALLDLAGLLSDSNVSIARQLFSRALSFPPLKSTLAAQLCDAFESLAKAAQRAGAEDLSSLRQPLYKASCLLAALSDDDVVSGTALYQPVALTPRLSSAGRALLQGLRRVYEVVAPLESGAVERSVRRRALRTVYHLLRPVRGEGAADFLQGLVRALYGAQSSADGAGSMFADLLRVYGKHLVGDSQLGELGELVGQLTGISIQSPSGPPPNPASDSKAINLEEAVQTIEAVLGESRYSRQFITASLGFFDNDVERCIDAMLTGNLPPALQYLADENLGKGEWRRREDEEEEEAKGYLAGLRLSAEDRRHLELQKRRVREAERRAELDSLIIRREYGDDYDDQFDEALSVPGSEQPLAPESSATRNIRWDVNLANIRRHNQLLKEEEREIAFWKELKVDNRAPPPKQEDRGNLNGEKSAAPAMQPRKVSATASNTSGSKNAKELAEKGGDGEGKEGEKGKKPKPRTKTFDKHHQKERATRKMNL